MVVVVAGRARKRWRTLAEAWGPLIGAIVVAVVVTFAYALPAVSSIFSAPVTQSLKYDLIRSGMGIQFGLQAPSPMAVGQPVTLTWISVGKYPYAPSNSSVYNPIMVISARNATGSIVVNMTNIGWGGGPTGALGGPSIYVPAGGLPGRMGGALYFRSPGPQVINVTMSYGLNASSKPGPLIDYSSSGPQPLDSVYIETRESVLSHDATILSLQATVVVGVFFAVITACAELTGLYDRARRITRRR